MIQQINEYQVLLSLDRVTVTTKQQQQQQQQKQSREEDNDHDDDTRLNDNNNTYYHIGKQMKNHSFITTFSQPPQQRRSSKKDHRNVCTTSTIPFGCFIVTTLMLFLCKNGMMPPCYGWINNNNNNKIHHQLTSSQQVLLNRMMILQQQQQGQQSPTQKCQRVGRMTEIRALYDTNNKPGDTTLTTTTTTGTTSTRKRQSRSSTVDVPVPQILLNGEKSKKTKGGKQKDNTESMIQNTDDDDNSNVIVIEDEDLPAGIGGAEFFGGNKQKIEFYDPIAEAEADILSGTSSTTTTTTTTAVVATTTTQTRTRNGNDDNKSLIDSTTIIQDNIESLVEIQKSSSTSSLQDDPYMIDRFTIPNAFDFIDTAAVARSIQNQINSVLYDDDDDNNNNETVENTIIIEYPYSRTNLKWTTPYPVSGTTTSTSTTSTTNPLLELEKALDFYRRIDVAITSGQRISSTTSTTTKTYQLRYEISIVWPIFWEPKVLLTGTSIVTIDQNTNEIIQQKDFIDQEGGGSKNHNNLPLLQIGQQIVPRFWDLYHVGMSPSTELSPQFLQKNPKKSIFSSYKLRTIPPRIVLQPTLQDSNSKSNRINNNAGFIPNHAFTCVIKTMGPTKQRYSTTSPIQVQINPTMINTGTTTTTTSTNILRTASPEKSELTTTTTTTTIAAAAGVVIGSPNPSSTTLDIQWDIPLSVEYISNQYLRLPQPDYDSIFDIQQQFCDYIYKPRTLYATIPFTEGSNSNSSPQDENVENVRKKLYEQVVVRDGHEPVLDALGRPKFSFVQHNVKACYTEEGLGMAIYEWRPTFARASEICLEIKMTEDNDSNTLQI